MKTAAIIPARNEEATVGRVVAAARSVVDQVIVVDNGSRDGTSQAGRWAGAHVVRHETPGKGEAMTAGVEATEAQVVVFLDADVVGLTPDHVWALVQPVVDGRAAMTRGILSRGMVMDRFTTGPLPLITGQRAMRREIFDSLRPQHQRGFKPEAAMEGLARAYELPTATVLLVGVEHRPKEKKWGLLRGLAARGRMFLETGAMVLLAALIYRWRRSRR
ncbi:MAG: glycosyltransferase [Actinomycetota bacterium]|nr:glycosyltransferase [Actinomycetota bacterium]